MHRPSPSLLVFAALALGAAASALLTHRHHLELRRPLMDAMISLDHDSQARHMAHVAQSIHEALAALEALNAGELDALSSQLEVRVKTGLVQMQFSDHADASMLEHARERAAVVLGDGQ